MSGPLPAPPDVVPGVEAAREVVSISDVRLEGVAGGRLGTPSRLTSGRTPTPTWTEGTPSYTESTYSGDTGQSNLPHWPPTASN